MELLESSSQQQSLSWQTIICSENIALLQFLHDVPSQPSTRELHGRVEDDVQRTLSLEQEQELSGILAFLSSIVEDVNLTTAVALREIRTHGNKQHTTSLEVLVAVNKSTVSESDNYLVSVCQGLGRIFKTLSRATSVHDAQIEQQVLTAIVSVCRSRILSRLRFGKHKRGKKKAHLREPLRKMCDALAPSTHPDARGFIQGTRRLIAALTRYENHQTDSELPSLIEEADSWCRMGDMTGLAREIPSSVLSGATYGDYRRIVGKVGQYLPAARRLYRLARKIEGLHRLQIKPIRLGPDAFVRPDLGGHTPSLERALDRILAHESSKGLAAILSGFMGKNPLKAQSDFVKDVNRVFSESKLHAEVQILGYLKTLPPNGAFATRVIQSNKKACFLCNEALKLNGTPDIPKSHGRLYGGWMLPILPAFKDLQLQLNESLQRRADVSIRMMLVKRRKIDLPFPVESTALAVSDVTSTEADKTNLLSVAPSTEALNGVSVPFEPGVSEKIEEFLSGLSGPEIPEQNQGLKTPKEASSNKASDLHLDVPNTAVDGVSITSEHTVKTEDVPRNETKHSAKKRSFSLSPGETSSIHTVGTSDTTIEYTTKSNQLKTGDTLIYSYRQLDLNDIENLRSRKTRFYDVLSLAKGSDITLRGPPPFYLDFGDSIAELMFHT